MITRYTRPEMGAIWELQNKFAIWKEIEILACEAQAELEKYAAGLRSQMASRTHGRNAAAAYSKMGGSII